jgi:hypothetical protein
MDTINAVDAAIEMLSAAAQPVPKPPRRLNDRIYPSLTSGF